MAHATLSATQIATLKSLRSLPEDAAKIVRGSLFASFKEVFNIPADHKVKVEVDNTSSPSYGVIVRKKDGTAYEVNSLGKWSGSVTTAPAAARPMPRWFRVDVDAAVDDILDTDSWDDGSSSVYGDAQFFSAENQQFAAVDGQLYVNLNADLF